MEIFGSYSGNKVEYKEVAEIPQVPTGFIRKDINLKVPSSGRFVQIKHDWEVIDPKTGKYYEPRSKGYKYAFPAIVNKQWGLKTLYNGKEYTYVQLPIKWQFFLWDLWNWSVDNSIPKGKITGYYTTKNNTGTFATTTPKSMTYYYVNMIEKSRAFTDSWSPEVGGYDAVTERNVGSKPYEWLMRTTTGNLCEVEKVVGRNMYLKALDITKDPPTIDWISKHPQYLHWATEVGGIPLSDKRYTVSNFPQAEACLGFPAGVPIPFMSLGGSIVLDKFAVKELRNGQSYSPYVPEK